MNNSVLKRLKLVLKIIFSTLVLIVFGLSDIWLVFSIAIKLSGRSYEDAYAMFFGFFIFVPLLTLILLLFLLLIFLSTIHLFISKFLFKENLLDILNSLLIYIKNILFVIKNNWLLLILVGFQLIIFVRFLIWCI